MIKIISCSSSDTSQIIITHSFSFYTSLLPCTSHLRSFSGVKDLALGVSGGGPSISEPRVLWKKEELHKESLTTGLCSLCSDPVTPGSQATIHSHLELCYRFYDEGDGQQPHCIQAKLREAIEGMRTGALLQQRHLSEHPPSFRNSALPSDQV